MSFERQNVRRAVRQRRYEIAVVVAEDTALQVQHTRVITVPSARLTATIEMYIEGWRLTNINQQTYVSTYTPATALGALYGITVASSRSNDNPLYIPSQRPILNEMLPNTQLPLAYEVVTGVKQVVALYTIQSGNANGNPVYTSWGLRVRYEPNVPMDDDELETLFGECGIK